MTANTKYCPVCNKPFPETETHCGCRRPPTALTAAPMIGKKLGNYIPFSLLGRGGMGEVYQAKHAHLGEICAIKTILLDTANDAQAVSRFLREAQLARALQSERIVRVLDYGNEPDGAEFIPYMALEWISGETLFDVLAREKVLPVARAVNIAVQIGEALEVAHSHPSVIIHRDLKPGNVMVLPGDRVKVVDFGLAKPTGSKPEHWNTLTVVKGLPMGTPMYFSPEQARFADDEIGPLSDLYAMGLILYQMLTGGFPFQIHFLPDGNWDYQRLYEERKTKAPTPVPRALSNGDALPEALCDAVMRALATAPSDRFENVRVFIDTIQTSIAKAAIPEGSTLPIPSDRSKAPDPDELFWKAIERSSEIEEFDKYLRDFPNGKYRPNAELSRDRLRKNSRSALPTTIPPPEPLSTIPYPKRNRPPEPTPLEQVVGKSLMERLLGIGIRKKGKSFHFLLWISICLFVVSGIGIWLKFWPEPIVIIPPSVNSLPTVLKNEIGLEFVLIPEGKFIMGSIVNDENLRVKSEELPQRQVTILKPFYLGRFEVTQGQWRKVAQLQKVDRDLKESPSHFNGCDECPVENISWEECQEFIARLNALNDNYKYRLPSEAEWEYSCRAGTMDDDSEKLLELGWFLENSGDKELKKTPKIDVSWEIFNEKYVVPNRNRTRSVGGKKRNGFNLYDMHGNVWEWCEDKYHENYKGAPLDGSAWVDGKNEERVLRGGSALNSRFYCRATSRTTSSKEEVKLHLYGLRVVAIKK